MYTWEDFKEEYSEEEFEKRNRIIEDKAKEKSQLKRYRDLAFFIHKIEYHFARIGDCKSVEIKKIKEEAEEKANELDYHKIKNINEFEEGALIHLEFDLNKRIGFSPLCFEFDSFMIDINRLLEFLIKFLAIMLDEKEPKKISNFFKGFTGGIERPSNLCKRVMDINADFAVYLASEWNSWIKNEIRKYRTDTLHNSIQIIPEADVHVHWKGGDFPDDPTKIVVENIEFSNLSIKFKDVDILDYATKIRKNIELFYQNIFHFISELYME